MCIRFGILPRNFWKSTNEAVYLQNYSPHIAKPEDDNVLPQQSGLSKLPVQVINPEAFLIAKPMYICELRNPAEDMAAEELTQIAFDIRSKCNSFGAILR